MWFDVMETYEGTGFLLSILSLASIVLYFVTTSDRLVLCVCVCERERVSEGVKVRVSSLHPLPSQC